MNQESHEQFVDAVERYDNLMEPALVRQADTPPALDDAGWDELATLVGPFVATLHAAGICAELLARWAGLTGEEIQAAREQEAGGLGSKPGTEVASSPSAALGELVALHQVVVNDLFALGARAVGREKG